MKSLIFFLVKRFVLSLFIIAAFPVYAGGHGGGGPSGPEPLIFTVNVGGPETTMKFLQVTMVFEFGAPEAAAHLAEIKPKVQHQIILRLSSEDSVHLQTAKGKLELQERLVEDLNALLHATPKTGVSEVLFTSFIIQ